MGELYLQGGTLVSEAAWQELIARLRSDVRCAERPDLSRLKNDWLDAFESAILERANEPRHGRIGVLFSGGVDSAFIAFILAKHNIPFSCYTAGFKDPGTKEPEDVIEAKQAAQRYGWQHKCVVLDLAAFEPLIKQTAVILGDAANPVTVGVGAVIVAAARLAKSDGITVLFGGLGSEEIFAGYHRHGKAQRSGEESGRDGVLHDEIWAGMLRMRSRDLVRDSRIAHALGISIATPFLDPRVIRLAMMMPEDEKIRLGHRKYVLRVIARDAGLDERSAFRQRRAAQYGSRVHKAIARLAKRKGMGEIAYIESAVPEATHG